ncbi:MAG: DUF1428 domain-containing protein [Hyphomicrobiaceae bacterium]
MDSYTDKYVDSFVLAVPTAKLDAYRKLEELAGRVWRDHGALEYVVCIADDVQPGKVTSFPQSVQLKEDETVITAWAVYRSREHRDEVVGKVMQDERMKNHAPADMPFDGMRMFWGGFKVLLEV